MTALVAFATAALLAAGGDVRAGASTRNAPSATHTAHTSFAVVASPDVPMDNLTFADLRRVFMLERRFWKPGQPLMVLFPPVGSSTRQMMLRQVCRANEREMRRMMLEKMYRGEIDLAPKVADTDDEALAYVASGRGLVAVVPIEMAERAQVKVLTLDGIRPGAAGYPLVE